jgi:hypothetical protein
MSRGRPAQISSGLLTKNGFYEKFGMYKPNDVVVLNKAEWTDFTVE